MSGKQKDFSVTYPMLSLRAALSKEAGIWALLCGAAVPGGRGAGCPKPGNALLHPHGFGHRPRDAELCPASPVLGEHENLLRAGRGKNLQCFLLILKKESSRHINTIFIYLLKAEEPQSTAYLCSALISLCVSCSAIQDVRCRSTFFSLFIVTLIV